MASNRDTIDRIVQVYFAAFTKSSFKYKGEIYQPKRLIISPLIFRGFTCPSHCGACCARGTLDWLPNEDRPYDVPMRTVDFNGKQFTIYSDQQLDHANYHCRNLDMTNGRCGIYGKHPWLCDEELIKVISYEDRFVLTQKLYGRGWNLTRIDGTKGSKCEMLPPDRHTIDEVLRKLYRWKDWVTYFQLDSRIPEIIEWAEMNARNWDRLGILHLAQEIEAGQ